MTIESPWLQNAATAVANTDPESVADDVRQTVEDAQQSAIATAQATAQQAVEEGAARLAEQERQGIAVIQDINGNALKVAQDYADKLSDDAERYRKMAQDAQAEAAAIIRKIRVKYEQGKTAVASAAQARESFIERIKAASDSTEGEQIVNELLSLEAQIASELESLASEIRQVGTQIAQEVKSVATDIYRETLEPLADWFDQEVITPLFGEGPGVLQKVSEWATQNARQLTLVKQAGSIFLGVTRTAFGILRATGLHKQNRCENSYLWGDFKFQQARWNLLMQAANGGTRYDGYRLPVYDRVFRFRLFQTYSVLPNMGIGQCNPWEGGLSTVKVDCPGIGTGDFYRSTNMLWNFIGPTHQLMIAEIWKQMGWAESLPRGCEPGPYAGRALLNERSLWPSSQKYNERYQVNSNGRPIITQFEGWPRISQAEVRQERYVTVPYRAGSGAPYVGYDPLNGLGQPIPEVPLTLMEEVPLLYLAFWFAPQISVSKARDLLRAYEDVVTSAQTRDGYTVNGFITKRGGELQPRGGHAWSQLSKVDAIPLLLDAPLTTQLFMGVTRDNAPVNAAESAVLDLLNMAETPDPRSALGVEDYKAILDAVTRNRSTDALVESRLVQSLKSPLMATSVAWANAVTSGSPRAIAEAKSLLAKGQKGEATQDEEKMINALMVALYGPDQPQTNWQGNVPLMLE
jgi:hypothetical protein